MYWMCVQLWRHNYSRICCTFRGRGLVIHLNLFSWTVATDWLAWETSRCSVGFYHNPTWKHTVPKKMESTSFLRWSPSTAEFEGPSFFPPSPLLSLPRSNFCTSSFSVGARRGRGSRGTASCGRPPASRNLPPERLRPHRCAAAPALRCRTPAPAVPRQILALPQRFVLTVPQQMYRNTLGEMFFERQCGRKAFGFTCSWSVTRAKRFFSSCSHISRLIKNVYLAFFSNNTMNWCWLRWHFLLKCPNNILGLDRPLPHYDSLICGLNKIGVKRYKDKKPLLNGLFIVNIKWSILLKVYCTFWLRSTFLDILTLPPTWALNMLLTPLFVAWTTESLIHYFWESFNDQH